MTVRLTVLGPPRGTPGKSHTLGKSHTSGNKATHGSTVWSTKQKRLTGGGRRCSEGELRASYVVGAVGGETSWLLRIRKYRFRVWHLQHDSYSGFV